MSKEPLKGDRAEGAVEADGLCHQFECPGHSGDDVAELYRRVLHLTVKGQPYELGLIRLRTFARE